MTTEIDSHETNIAPGRDDRAAFAGSSAGPFVVGVELVSWRKARRKAIYAVLLVSICSLLGVALGITIAAGGAALLQLLWNSVRG